METILYTLGIMLCVLAFPAMGAYHYFTTGKTKRILHKELSKVKNGQKIKVNISGWVVNALCINNTPSDKKMFVRMFLDNGKVSESVERYDEFTFINFIALNTVELKTSSDDLEDLQYKLNKALKNQKYEEAAIWRDAISKLKTSTEKQIKN